MCGHWMEALQSPETNGFFFGGGGDFKLWFNEAPIRHVEVPQWRGQRANGGTAFPNDDGVRGKGWRKSLFVMWTDKVEILEILEQGLAR